MERLGGVELLHWRHQKPSEFDETIHLNPKRPRAHHLRGFSKKQSGQNAAAIADFDIAIRLEQTSAYSHYHRGGAKLELGRSAEAKADLEEALSLAKQSDNDALTRWILNLLHKIE